MSAADVADLWWKNAVIYCLDVETYLDADHDGTGDFIGLTDRVEHLDALGIDCIWLMPFYPAQNRDDGYDITDFYSVDPRLGSLGDVVVFLRAARDRGIRVIVDLVVNHTSDKHPWFKAARRSRDDPMRDWYVWADEPPPSPDTGVVFPDAEDSIWTKDDRTGQWYLHHFYSHQPDLNIANPAVRNEIAKIAGFWLEVGVDGFRVDAVPYLIETGGTNVEGDLALDPHELLRDLRRFLGRRRGDAATLGEVNLPPDQIADFFGEDDELQLLFDFPLMQAMYLSLARGDARPLRDALERRPPHAGGRPVGDLRAQPRRADPGPAERVGASRGLRRVRSRGGHAALRAGAAAAAATDARRRPGEDAARVQPALLTPRHPGAVLRRGDRDGREPRRARPARGAHADAMGSRPDRRVHRCLAADDGRSPARG